MKTLIQLTEVALIGDAIKEVAILIDPVEIAIIEQGTQRTATVPLLNTPNQSIPVSIITVKSGRKISVKENFDGIRAIINNATD